jgi:glutamine synthetase
MTDATKAAMRDDTEGFFKNESKMLDFTCSNVNSMRRLAK